MSEAFFVKSRPTSAKELAKLALDGTLFAVLDACGEPALPAKMRALGEERAACLYRGTDDPDLLAIAPYLVWLDAPLLEWLTGELWSKPWGILVAAKTSLRALRRHLRTLLVVQGPDHDFLYFRYYDPRVLVTFLPTCTREELDQVYGPVLAYGVARPDGAALFARA